MSAFVVVDCYALANIRIKTLEDLQAVIVIVEPSRYNAEERCGILAADLEEEDGVDSGEYADRFDFIEVGG